MAGNEFVVAVVTEALVASIFASYGEIFLNGIGAVVGWEHMVGGTPNMPAEGLSVDFDGLGRELFR